MAAGAFVASLYWTAVTYGSVTVLQVLGQDAVGSIVFVFELLNNVLLFLRQGLEMLESTDSIFLLISLPAIPVSPNKCSSPWLLFVKAVHLL